MQPKCIKKQPKHGKQTKIENQIDHPHPKKKKTDSVLNVNKISYEGGGNSPGDHSDHYHGSGGGM